MQLLLIIRKYIISILKPTFAEAKSFLSLWMSFSRSQIFVCKYRSMSMKRTSSPKGAWNQPTGAADGQTGS